MAPQENGMTCRIVEEYGDERAAEAAAEAKNEVVEGMLQDGSRVQQMLSACRSIVASAP